MKRISALITVFLLQVGHTPCPAQEAIVLQGDQIDPTRLRVGAYAWVIYHTPERNVETAKGYIKAVDDDALTVWMGLWKEKIAYQRIIRLTTGRTAQEVIRLEARKPKPPETDQRKTRPAPGHATVELVPGLACMGASFGDDNPKQHQELGVTIGGKLWLPLGATRMGVVEGAWQLNKMENPHFDEAFRSLYLEAGLGGKPSGAFLRPSVGVALLSWSGAMASEGTDLLPLLGLTCRPRCLTIGNMQIAPELKARVIIGGGLIGWMVGLQTPLGLRGGMKD